MIKVTNKSQFTNQLKAVVRRLEIDLDTAIQKVAVDTYRGVTEKNRVDTGYSRASWNLGINQVDPSVADPAKFAEHQTEESAKASAADRNAQQIAKARPARRYFITNNVPYIIYLEEGTETRTGDHMVSRTVAEMQERVKIILQGIRK